MYTFQYNLNKDDLRLSAKLLAFTAKVKFYFLWFCLYYYSLVGSLIFLLVLKGGMPVEIASCFLIIGTIYNLFIWEKLFNKTKKRIYSASLRVYEKPEFFNKYFLEGNRYILLEEKGLFISRDDFNIENGLFTKWRDFNRLIESNTHFYLIAEGGISILMKKDSTTAEYLNRIKDKLKQIQLEEMDDVINI